MWAALSIDHFNIADLPSIGLSLGGGTTNNTASGFSNGPAPDDFAISILDCVNARCGFPAGSLGNVENLGFEERFLNCCLSGGFTTIGDFVDFLLARDLENTPSFFNSSYVPESLLPLSMTSVESANGDENGQPDIRFVSISGTITRIQLVPEPLSIIFGVFYSSH